MNRPKERIEFYDPDTNAVLLVITDPTWLDILAEESNTLHIWARNEEIIPGVVVKGLMEHPNLIRIPADKGFQNSKAFRILQMIFNKIPLVRKGLGYYLGGIRVDREDLFRALSYFMIREETMNQYLDMIFQIADQKANININSNVNVEQMINDKVKERKAFLFRFEPHIGSERSNANLWYQAHMANVNRREAAARKRWIKNSNSDEYIERNWEELRGEPPNLERNYEAELNLPLETLKMSDIEFEKWMRTHPDGVKLRKAKNKTMNRNWNLGRLFKNTEGGRRKRFRKTRHRK